MTRVIKYGLILASGFIILGTNLLLAQQKPITSQYMFNELAINPAFAGSHQWFSATAMYRDQWVNLDGSPTTSTFSMHTGMSSTKVGLGILVYKDQIGIHDDLGLYASYSYFVEPPERRTDRRAGSGWSLALAACIRGRCVVGRYISST